MRFVFLLFLILVFFSGCDVQEVQRGAGSVSEISDAVSSARVETESQLEQVLELVRAGNAASGAVNPYAIPLEAALASLAGLAGAWGAWKGRKAKQAEGKYQAHKAGVERTVKELGVLPEGEVTSVAVDSLLYSNIGEARKNS
jgi:hypothetical protein